MTPGVPVEGAVVSGMQEPGLERQWIWPKPRTRAPEGIWLHMIRRTLTLNRILDGTGAGDRGVLYKAGIDCGHNE